MPFALPPPLRPGDRVAVVAPSSPFPHAEFFRGLAWLRGRYRVEVRAAALLRSGYLAGRDADRAGALAWALTAPGISAVVAARGGYGAMRVLDDLPWEKLVASPRWLVGFSDVTALHLEAQRRGVASVHGANVTGLGSAPAATRLSWIRAMEQPAAASTWAGLRVVHAGRAVEGPVLGGNLALVEAMAAAGRLVLPAGCILCLEDVTERPYRIDRMLTSLLIGAHLARAAAIVFGGFTRCEPLGDGITVDEVLAERTARLGVPVVAGAPFGHGDENLAFVLGRRARLDGPRLSFL